MSAKLLSTYLKIYAFVFLLISLAACRKETSNPPQQNVLNKNTVVADDQTKAVLVNVTQDQLVFQGSSQQLNDITSGDIIVSAPTTLAPSGYLRKIIAVTRSNGQVVLYTQNATLEDAIEECNIAYSKSFNIADTLTGKKEDVGFGDELNLTLYDRDGSLATTNDQIILTGSYEINPDFLFSLQMTGARVKYLKMGLGLTETMDVHLHASLLSSSLISDEIPLANFPLTPIVIWAGNFPIVVRPVIKFIAGHETSINAEVSAGWSGSAYQEAYLEYTRNVGWNVGADKSLYPTVIEHTLSGSVTSETYVKAEMQFILYDFDGVTADLYGKSYIEAGGTCTITPSGFDDCGWNIKAGFKAGGEANVEVFGHSLLNYSHDIFDYKETIYETTPAQNGKVPIVIDNLQDYFTNVNDCWMSDYNYYGSSHTMTFDIEDPSFNPYNYFEIRSVAHFSNGYDDYDYLNSNSVGVTVIDYNTIQITWCTHFGDTEYMDEEITLLNDVYESNPITKRIYKPYGANKKEGGVPANRPLGS